jgi:hypothetical protein
VSGWSASRSFTPFRRGRTRDNGVRALALLVNKTAGPTGDARRRVGSVLLLLQLALAAWCDHIVGLAWHVLVGGLAATAVLVPASP